MKATSTSSTSATTQTLERITVSTVKMPASSAYVSPTLGALEHTCSIRERERIITVSTAKMPASSAYVSPTLGALEHTCSIRERERSHMINLPLRESWGRVRVYDRVEYCVFPFCSC